MGNEGQPGRLAELTIALSLATDLGTGQPLEHGLRTCWLSLQAADALGLDDTQQSCVYFVALLRFLGCTSDASQTAVLAGGDELTFNATMGPMLNAKSSEGMRYFVRHLGEEQSFGRRVGLVARAMTDPGGQERSLTGHCEVGARLATRLGMPESVCAALSHAYERWDGKGYAVGLAGDDIPIAIQIVTVCRDAELWSRQVGWADTMDVLGGRRGHAYAPAVVDAVLDSGHEWAEEITDDVYAQVLDAEPRPYLVVDPDDIDRAVSAIGDFADMKSPWFLGHSAGVASLAADAARAAGLSEADGDEVKRAALVHDVGRVGVAGGIWDRPGALSPDQWERVRLHAYYTERVLDRCALLAPFAAIATRHHERLDGSGYHRGASGDQLALAARLLAAADAYHAMTEDRPYRPALAPEAATAQLLDDADAGRFNRAEVDAVLEAAGQLTRPASVGRPAGLTEREVDVLRLIARGRTNKQVAADLGISAKTVGTHVEHIYAKAQVTTRAGATLFAMEQGLL